jgi:hypothetical protein
MRGCLYPVGIYVEVPEFVVGDILKVRLYLLLQRTPAGRRCLALRWGRLPCNNASTC